MQAAADNLRADLEISFSSSVAGPAKDRHR
jgi:hypothetical protein